MENEIFRVSNDTARVYRCNTAIVGSGAAGFNAADRLWKLGQHVSADYRKPDRWYQPQHRKRQTDLLQADTPAATVGVREMAQTLYGGRCVDGDIALCRKLRFLRCFLKLIELGVPFLGIGMAGIYRL